MSDFGNLTLVEKLSFYGCTSLQKVHPSIGQLTSLSHLDLGECDHLKELPESIGQLTNLRHLDLGRCRHLEELSETIGQLTNLRHLELVWCASLKRLPEDIRQLTNLGSLNLGGCRSLTRLPEQLGDMRCLKKIDASFTSIEQLPDSIGHLKELVHLNLYCCEKLGKLPEQIGNLESLKWFDAGCSAIEYLPDTFGGLTNLEILKLIECINLTSLPNSLWKLKVLRVLDVSDCSKLEQLPEQLGKMQCLEKLLASGTAIEELPDSIGLLSMLKELNFDGCKNFRKLPSSMWNLTSLAKLYLKQQNVDTIIFPDTVKDMKLEYLSLSCNVSLWLPAIQSFSSLVTLDLWYESQILSSNEVYSLSKLANLQHLRLRNCTSHDFSLSEFPVNVRRIYINYATVEMLPELSSLKQLKILSINSCIRLQSIPPLPPHLEELSLYDCTNLQDIPDLSMLKDLRSLGLGNCSNLKFNSLKQSFHQVCRYWPQSVNLYHRKFHSFEANIPDMEVAEWFSYKSNGDTLSFTIPPNVGDNLLGVGLWIVYKPRYTYGSNLNVTVTNRTKKIKNNYDIYLPCGRVVGEVQSRIVCIKTNPMKSGDRIKISIQSKDGRTKVKKCGAHLMLQTPS